MSVIIAIIPATGHEGLVAEGPMGERPALLYRCGCGQWGAHPRVGAVCHERKRTVALVLHAPGDPKLGMVRLMEALFGDDADEVAVGSGSGKGRVFWRDGQPYKKHKSWPVPLLDAGVAARVVHAAAHLAVQRGIATEVLVLSKT